MKEQLISFETAKLAKEKGFKHIQDKCYDPKYSNTFDWHEEIKYSTQERIQRLIPAPTQSLLQRWLREEHSIHIQIAYYITATYVYRLVDVQCDPGNEIERSLDERYSGSEYTSYEEAIEEALLEALKLIKL